MPSLKAILGVIPFIGDETGFPSSAGERERGKFRPSNLNRSTTVAVVADDGGPIPKTTNELLEELVYETKLLRHALVLGGLAADLDEPLD